jgi:hypothetical protein
MKGICFSLAAFCLLPTAYCTRTLTWLRPCQARLP